MVVIITGLTLSGKSTMAKELIRRGYRPVLEYTTRPMRKGEKNNVDYHFVDDVTFDVIEAAGEFAEIFHVETIYGLWKYGAKKEDLKDDCVFTCGTNQIPQLLSSGIPCFTVLLDIKKDTAMNRAIRRGDNPEEFNRRFAKDKPSVDAIRSQVDLILDADNRVDINATIIEDTLSDKVQ